jgi:hypothetical protein
MTPIILLIITFCFYSGLLESSAPPGAYNFSTVTWQNMGKSEWKLNNLRNFYKYGIVVQAFNNKGPGPLSAEIVAQTLEDGM